MKKNTATGSDRLTVEMIQTIMKYKASEIVSFINQSFQTGKFCSDLKIAKVIPVYKKGDPENFTNYRPISILSNFSKLIEKIMNKKLLNFLNKNSILSINQFGFREGLNTEKAIISLTSEIHAGISQNQKVAVIFLDVKKSF